MLAENGQKFLDLRNIDFAENQITDKGLQSLAKNSKYFLKL